MLAEFLSPPTNPSESPSPFGGEVTQPPGRYIRSSLLLLLLTLFPAGCCGSGPEETVPDGRGPPLFTSDPSLEPADVVEMRLIPDSVFARAGDAFWVDLVLLNANKKIVSNPDLAVDWSSPSTVTLRKRNGGAWITPQNVPGVRPTWKVEGIEARIGGLTAALALQVSNLGLDPGNRRRLTVGLPWTNPGTPETRPTAVLFDVQNDEDCPDDVRISVAGGTFLPDNLGERCDARDVEVSLFSPLGRGLLTSPLTPTVQQRPEWFQRESPETFNLTGRVPITLVFWEWAEAGEVWNEMSKDFQYAQFIFDRGRLGLDLRKEDRERDQDHPAKTFKPESTDCDGTAPNDLQTMTQGEIGDGAARKIHVIYAESVEDEYGVGVRGKYCFWTDARAPAIVVSNLKRSPSTLAHEIAHLLGMNERTLLREGHTMAIAGMGPSNLMWQFEDPNQRGNRGWLTLGQAYRMSFDVRSWVNYALPRTGNKCCEKSEYLGVPCPELWFDIVQRVDPGLNGESPGKLPCGWW